MPGQETSIARRGPKGRPRRTYGGTSQGAPWGPATPLGEVNWNGTSKSPITLSLLLVLTVMLSCVAASDKRGRQLDQIKLPPGFAINIYATDVPMCGGEGERV